tara:strand:+ start:5499 stop:6032 length:534 start_codon:yes stop_codon:yes gene_type:complete
MLLKPMIIKYITTGIIAPHGITDLIHAEQNKNIVSLLNIYVSTNSLFFFLETVHLSEIINVILFTSSIVHFQRDVPIENKNVRYFFTASMLLYFIFINSSNIFIYLSLIHVPNHYKNSWYFLKNNKIKTFLILILTTTVSLVFGMNYYELYENPMIFDIIKGIIISHILYEELYIYN